MNDGNHDWQKDNWVQPSARNVKEIFKCINCGLYKIILKESDINSRNYYYSLKRNDKNGAFDVIYPSNRFQTIEIYDTKPCSEIIMENILK